MNLGNFIIQQESPSPNVSVNTLSKQLLNEEEDLNLQDGLNIRRNSFKFSTPIPPPPPPAPKSASIKGRKVAVKQLIRKIHTANNIDIEALSVINANLNDNSNIDNLSEIKNEDLESRTKPNEKEERKASVAVVAQAPTLSSTPHQTTLSEYNLDLLYATETDFNISIDSDTKSIVETVMNKMLKLVCRKVYLYKVGIFKPENNVDDSSIEFFSKHDSLFNNKKKVQIKTEKIDDEIFDMFDKNDEFSEALSNTEDSVSNESFDYYTYAELDLDVDYNVVEEKKPTYYISSEEDETLDEEERLELNRQLKEELKFLNYWILNTNVGHIKNQLIHLRNSVVTTLEVEKFPKRELFHDDYFLTEFNEAAHADLKSQQKHDASKQPTTNLLPKRNAVDKSGKELNKKENVAKRREERIKMMEKAFSTQSTNKRKVEIEQKKQRFVKSANVQYKKPVIKSNIITKVVPIDYQEKAVHANRLPNIKSAKNLPTFDYSRIKSVINQRRAKTAPAASAPIDERQKYPRPVSSKQPWGTIMHPPYGLGYQRMTPYEIKQSVERLYYLPKDKTNQTKVVSCLPKSDFIEMVRVTGS